jgi:NAD(P)-dependent dehydrogenase (short-subunit alcohol dehydrogenase family)
MDFGSVRKAAKDITEIATQNDGLDVLVNNAGIMAHNDSRTAEGFDVQMHTNHLSHFLLTSLLYPSLETAACTRGEARIVSHSSSARFFPSKDLEEKYFVKSDAGSLGGDSVLKDMFGFGGPATRYHMSKLSNSCFAIALHHKLQARHSKVMSMAADPGVASSGLATSASSGDGALQGWLVNLLGSSAQSPADGCLPAAMCAFSPQALSGDLYKPRFGTSGAPLKSIEEASDVDRKAHERLTLTKANQENVWKWSEDALGIKFEV